MNENIKKPIYKRWWFITLAVLMVIGFFGSLGEKEEDPPQKPTDKGAEYNITGGLDVDFKDNKAIAVITTNAIDGSIFEIALMDSGFNMVSDFVPVKNGQGVREFDVPDEWDVGYISGTAMMRFTLEEHPQGEEVKEFYGEKGEKITGDFVNENKSGGKDVSFEIITAPYPDAESVKIKQAELFENAVSELKEASNGIIINVVPLDGEDWRITRVTVSDAWYHSPEYEQERFAEQIGETVKNIILNTERVKGNDSVRVYFYDAYNKELASPKALGGYKIKN